MSTDGSHVPNITCRHCNQQHSWISTCSEARLMAENAQLRAKVAELEQTIENLEYDAMETADYNTHGE